MKTAHPVTRPLHAMSVKDSEREDSFNKDAFIHMQGCGSIVAALMMEWNISLLGSESEH